MNQHHKYQEQISQYVDRELAKDEWEAMFVHLSNCSICRGFLSDVLELRSRLLADTLSTPSMPSSRVFRFGEGKNRLSLRPVVAWINGTKGRISLSIPATAALFLMLIGATLSVEKLLEKEETKVEVVDLRSLPVVDVQVDFIPLKTNIRK